MHSTPDASVASVVADSLKFVTPDRTAAAFDKKFIRHPMAKLIGAKIARKFAEGGGFIIFEAPPRHGKSWMVSKWTPLWFLHWFPDEWVAIVTYGATFSSRWGRMVRSTIKEHGDALGIHMDPSKQSASEIELTTGGGMFCTGIGGELTGRGFRLLVIDDPVKNAEEANSEVIREKHWEWWQSVAGTRLEPGAVVVVMMTRWHEDDLIGRLKAEMAADPEAEQWDIVRIPAICEEVPDPLGRAVGDPLWPVRYPLAKLKKIARRVGNYFWAAMFQQRPAPLEGGFFERAWLAVEDGLFRKECFRVRSWDLAGTTDGDATAGVLIARDWRDDSIRIEDVVRVQMRPHDVEQTVIATAQMDGPGVTILIQRDPAQAGLAQYERYERLLRAAGFRCEEYLPTGDKDLRIIATASPIAQAGDLSLTRADWNAPFINEACAFPNGTRDDMLDALASGIDHIAKVRRRMFGGPKTETAREHDDILGRVAPGGARRNRRARDGLKGW